MHRAFPIVATLALVQLGCAEQLHLLDRGPVGGVSPSSFWPPPGSSVTWFAEATEGAQEETLSSVAERLELGLRADGYVDQRWYPVGAGSAHGFAVTTRLERVEAGRPARVVARWSSLHAEAVSLRWLEQARSPTLPTPGRYRVLLVSYTDLPIGPSSRAPVWNEETVMDWPNATKHQSSREVALPRRTCSECRFGIYEYEFRLEEDSDDARGRFVPATRTESRPFPLRGISDVVTSSRDLGEHWGGGDD
jgi:hypothetical protein